MPSCSNSSNISGRTIFNDLQAVGSRLVTVLNSNSDTIDGSIAIGDVIRYQATGTTGYVRSLADTPANSEVFGVVETISGSFYTVVLSGQIKYIFPTDVDLTGGDGGNDIYFLSNSSAGKLQNISPSTLGSIIKPILQKAPVGEYSAVVHNYIGYQLGGEVEAVAGSLVGSVETFAPGTSLPPDFVDASSSHELNTLSYPDLYGKIGKKYGHVVRVVVDSTKFTLTPSIEGKPIDQKSANITTVSGKVKFVNSSTVDVILSGTQSTKSFSLSSKLNIGGKDYGTPVSANVVSFFTPKITLSTNPYVFLDNQNTRIGNDPTIGYMITDTRRVSIPEEISVKSLKVNETLSIGSSVTDVSGALIDVYNDLNLYKTKLNTTSSLVSGGKVAP